MAKLINDLIDLRCWAVSEKLNNYAEKVEAWDSITKNMTKIEKKIHIQRNGLPPAKYKPAVFNSPDYCSPVSYKVNNESNSVTLKEALAHKRWIEDNGGTAVVMLSLMVAHELTGVILEVKDLDGEKDDFDSERAEELLNMDTYIERSPSGLGHHIFFEIIDGYTLITEDKGNKIDTLRNKWVSMTADVYKDMEVMKAPPAMLKRYEPGKVINPKSTKRTKIKFGTIGLDDDGDRAMGYELIESDWDASKHDPKHRARMKGVIANDMLIDDMDKRHIRVLCPNADRHGSSDMTGTYLMPADPDNDKPSSVLYCNHDGCRKSGTSIADLDKAIDIKEHRMKPDDFIDLIGKIGRDDFEALKKVLKIAVSEGLDKAEMKYLAPKMVAQVGSPIVVGDVMAVWAELKQIAKKEDHEEIKAQDLADAFLNHFGSKNIKVLNCKLFYLYSVVHNGEWFACMHEEMRSIIDNFLRDEFFINATGSLVRGVIEVLENRTDKWTAEIQEQRNVINHRDGVIEMDSEGKPFNRPHRRNDYCVNQLPIILDCGCKDVSKDYNKFLHSTFEGALDGSDRVLYLEETAGQSLTTCMDPPKVTYLIGQGRNGKSVFASLLEAAVGADNLSNINNEEFNEKFNLALIDGKLVNLASEGKAKKVTETDKLKGMSEGKSVKAEHKGVTGFMMYPHASFWQLGNSSPRFDDISLAVLERFRVIWFPNSFPEKVEDGSGEWIKNPARIDGLEEILEKDLPIIVMHWIRVWFTAKHKGEFVNPESSKDYMEYIKVSSFPELSFVEEELIKNASSSMKWVTFCKLYDDYTDKKRVRAADRLTHGELWKVMEREQYKIQLGSGNNNYIYGVKERIMIAEKSEIKVEGND